MRQWSYGHWQAWSRLCLWLLNCTFKWTSLTFPLTATSLRAKAGFFSHLPDPSSGHLMWVLTGDWWVSQEWLSYRIRFWVKVQRFARDRNKAWNLTLVEGALGTGRCVCLWGPTIVQIRSEAAPSARTHSFLGLCKWACFISSAGFFFDPSSFIVVLL